MGNFFQSPAPVPLIVQSKAANYVVLPSDDLVIATTSNGTTFTLPSASIPTKVLRIRRMDQDLANALTVARASADTIVDSDGTAAQTSTVLYTLGEEITLVNTSSTVWMVVNRYIPNLVTAYTPTFTGLGTVSGVEVYWNRSGDILTVQGRVTAGTSTGVEARISLPTGLVSSTTKIPTIRLGGTFTYSVAVASAGYILIEPTVAYVTFGEQTAAAAGLAKVLGSDIIASGQSIAFEARIPIVGWRA